MKPNDILKEARERKSLTQTEVATLAGIGLRQYQNYEDGKFPKFKNEKIILLDKILETKIYELLYEKSRSNEQKGEVKHENLAQKTDRPIPLETINDTARSLIVLSDANKEACISSKEASIANRILAENQRELIAMLKGGSGLSLGGLMTGQNLADVIHPYLHVLAEGGVKAGIWSDQLEAHKMLGKLLSGLPKENIV